MISYALCGIRLLLLLFSFYGYVQALKNRYKIPIEFLLPIVFSSVGVIMFFAGMLNILDITALAAFLLGIACAVISIKNKNGILQLVTPGTVVMAITLCVLLAITIGNKFTHYDNFSHWATVLKQIIKTDTFPNFDDKNIMFQSYPVGSAAFIYYFTKITGVESEWFCIFVQQVLTVAMLCSVFAFFRSRKVLTVVFGCVFIFFILFADVEFTVTHDLLVDILLPCVAIASMSICFYYRENINRYCIALLPLITFLIAIKNSGVLFAAVIILFYAYRCKKNSGARSVFTRRNAVLVCAPVLTLFLWNRHVAYVFEQGRTAKHSMSIEYYKQVLREKDWNSVAEVVRNFFDRVFSFDNPFVFVFVLLIILLAYTKISKAKMSMIGEYIAVVALFFVAWVGGVLATYVFSMPTSEAVPLIGYDRYIQTGSVFCLGILCILVGVAIENSSVTDHSDIMKKIASIAVLGALCVCSMLSLSSNPLLYDGRMYPADYRESFDSALDGYELDKSGEANYFVVWNGIGYERFMCRYYLNPNELLYCGYGDFQSYIQYVDNYDYFVVPEHNEIVDEYLMQKFGSSDQNVYKIN